MAAADDERMERVGDDAPVEVLRRGTGNRRSSSAARRSRSCCPGRIHVGVRMNSKCG